MTDTLETAQVAVHDRVRLLATGRYARYNTTLNVELTPDVQLVVTRVYNDNVMVRTVDNIIVYGEATRASFSIPRRSLTLWDANAPRPRRLGQKPEDTEEMTFIDVNDPRVKWIWDDLGTYAENKNWCSEYDQLCARVGIPGRPRDFTVGYVVGGISIRATVKAHSQREANEMVKIALAAGAPDEAGTPAPNPDFALAG